ncbi:MAG: Serine/threonine-protein kinase PknD [Chroococcidiopsis cubana SAG 39.79]|jgi:WD40 repeat protein|uniref:Serine/threonine protein kinase with WD40 repeats n=2 Tax=Chroococcidiopsis TaxID=54298 RepID=K9TZ22_CHRTP|nr:MULTISPECIES: serine/threonine-protein kinase [Chroococcidiopsis]AFY87416.1 serine/threonine protein kinase with WD40 repeats [Chroococcidiopsis thermalis PCC 7203]MDZ4875102.1 Serine/threonine-protein kinase PknD [Chroococcidiopsis cubana SAG 39.79]PSB63273.1 serine/threonine protein kinase [Chroococcidiopsis cubana CCALA 043]RUT09385.1 hypothetical protein DSM107010_45010 [Chroococcidiopsis cubana SAG 39.79]
MLGEIIKGQYQIVQILSSSDYCQTYLAQDLVTPSPQACIVKHLLPGPSGRTSSLSSLRRVFTREVAALEKLSTYSQVPQLLNYFELDQQFYLVLEYIHGQPLNRVLAPGVRWSETQVIDFLQEVLTILEVIHAHGLIHRDIKPSNLIQRDSDGKLVLIDFGSVKQAWTQVVTAAGQTNANFAMGIPATMAIGTPGYMPSEQSRGRPRPNSDIYALGMIAIQALTGMQPTMLLEDADSGEVIWQHLTNVTLALGSILNQMVRYHFTERYQSATEVLADLQPLLPTAALSQPTPISRSSAPNSASTAPNSSSHHASAVNGSGTKSRRTSTGGQQQIALWLGMAIGITSALGLILGLYYALRPGSKAVPPIAPPKAQFAAIASNRLSDRYTLTQTLTGHTDSVWAIAVSQDGRTLVSGSADKTIKVWDLQTRELQRTLTGHTDTVRAIALSQDGQILVSGGGEKTVRLWNITTGRPLGRLLGHGGPVWTVAISQDGQTLFSAGEDGTVKLWNAQNGQLHRTLPAHDRRVFSLAVSPNGQTFATGSIDRTIKLWDLATGRLLRTLTGHTDAVRAITFSPDGQHLASTSWDKTVKIWNWRTGEQLQTLAEHEHRTVAIAYGHDGNTLMSASLDRTIKIWQPQSGQLLHDLLAHTDWVLAIVPSPRGQTLVSSSKDRTIKIWE